ncbi:hypothetical protein BC940DRAFT_316546 [Gongronella butleri]|nr:hypothetical protein BC940DRAFT_316546 [Gongronella butleri]
MIDPNRSSAMLARPHDLHASLSLDTGLLHSSSRHPTRQSRFHPYARSLSRQHHLDTTSSASSSTSTIYSCPSAAPDSTMSSASTSSIDDLSTPHSDSPMAASSLFGPLPESSSSIEDTQCFSNMDVGILDDNDIFNEMNRLDQSPLCSPPPSPALIPVNLNELDDFILY